MGADHRHRGVGPARIVVARCAQDLEPQRVEHVGAESAGPHRDRPDGVAVVRAAESEVAGPGVNSLVRPELEGDLDGLFHGGGAVGGEQEMGFAHRHHRGEGLGELDGDPVAVPEQGAVRHPVDLFPQGLVELGDTMTDRGHPQRRDGIEVSIAFHVDEFVALGGVDDHRLVLGVHRHLGEAVPHDGRIAVHPSMSHGGAHGEGPGGLVHPASLAPSGSSILRRRHCSMRRPMGVEGGPSTKGQISSASRRQFPVACSSPNMA